MDKQKRRRNVRTGLILASIALAFMFGYIVRRMIIVG